MINKIIFLIEYPFGQRDYNRYGIEILQKNGFEVEVWDFTSFLQPKVYREIKVPDPISWEKCIIFLTCDKAISAILKLASNCFVVCMISYEFNSFLIYKALSKINIPYCVFMANALPPVSRKKSFIESLNGLKNITSINIINILFKLLPYRFFGILPATFILAGGMKSNYYSFPVSDRTETLWMHTMDYDIFLKESRSLLLTDSKMGVFLDEFIPFHPDNLYVGKSAYLLPEEYYPILCRFFDIIEHTYNIQIVIAAHPRSDYDKRPDYFNGRLVVKGKTAELIRKSKLVLSHLSTSINFAVLFHKPVIYITSNRLQQSYWGQYIDVMSSQFGKKPVNMDNPGEVNWEEELSIDERAYANYKMNYIKKDGSVELPFWLIFSNRIKEFNK